MESSDIFKWSSVVERFGLLLTVLSLVLLSKTVL